MSKKPPNVIFILTDDMGWGDTAFFGHPTLNTPHLDRLAEEGSVYTQFYVAAPVCSPSRGSFLTGQFPARHGIHYVYTNSVEQNEEHGTSPGYLDPQVTTVSKQLQQAGYATAHFGKWHLGGVKGAPHPGEYGFDEHRTFNSTGPGWNQKTPKFRAHSSQFIVDETIRFIEEHRDQPYYVNVWLLEPHATLDPTPEQLEPYRHLMPANVEHPGALAIYQGVISNIDKQVGRLVNRLAELGLSEDTLIVFTSDNGPESIEVVNASHSATGRPGPFRGRKRSLYEGGIRMPFIVYWPGRVPSGIVDNDTVIGSVDFLPTVCSLAGVDLPEEYVPDGENMSDALLGKRVIERSRPLFWERRYPVIGHVIDKSPLLAVRKGRWKLLINPDDSRVELYDIPADPTELSNVADRQPEVVAELSALAKGWQKELPAGPVHPKAGSNEYPWPRPRKIEN